MAFIDQFNLIKKQIVDFFNFLIARLKNFKNITLGEQIAFGSMGGGIVFTFISLILFVI